MGAGRYDLTIEQGATYSKTLTWKDSNKAAINLTSYTARMQIRETKESTTTLATSEGTSPSIVITLGGALGTILITMTAAITAAFTFDTAVYDLEMILSGAVTRLLEGDVFLSKEVTR